MRVEPDRDARAHREARRRGPGPSTAPARRSSSTSHLRARVRPRRGCEVRGRRRTASGGRPGRATVGPRPGRRASPRGGTYSASNSLIAPEYATSPSRAYASARRGCGRARTGSSPSSRTSEPCPIRRGSAIQLICSTDAPFASGSSRPGRSAAVDRGRQEARAQRQERGPDRLVDVPVRRRTGGRARAPVRPAAARARASGDRRRPRARTRATAEAGDRRQRDEPVQLGQVEAQRFDDLLDERGAEVHAGEPGLAVRDRIEDRGVGVLEIELGRARVEQRRELGRDPGR